jgi:small nuclear ribonucleoprotein D3
MNCQMSDVTVTLRDGRTQTLDNVFIRGSQIRFLILPDMLKNAPMFKVSILFMIFKTKHFRN